MRYNELLMEKLQHDAICDKIGEGIAAREEHFRDLVFDYACKVRGIEKRGFGEWVKAEDGLPAEDGIYLVRGIAEADGEKVAFEEEMECDFRIENYWGEWCEIERGYGTFEEDYDVVPYWITEHVEKEKGFRILEVTAWTQAE